MLEPILLFFSRWVNLGVDKDQPSHLQKLTLFTNIMAIPSFMMAFASTLSALFTPHPILLAILISGGTAFGQVAVWSLNYQRKNKLARLTFVIVQQASLLATSLTYPKELGMEPYWFIMIIFSHLLFDSQEIRTKIFFVSTAFVFSVLAMMGYLQLPTVLIPLDPNILEIGIKFHAINSTIYFLLSTAGFSAMNYHFEKKLEANEMQILQSNKLASLGEISGGIAHEINNPLSIIIGRAELLKSKLDQNNITTEFLSSNLMSILQTARRIAKVVYGLKKFARASEKEPRSDHQLIDIVNDTLILTQEKLKSQGIDVITQGVENTTVYCNSLQLSQVLYNLISNSAEHMKALSEKWIRIEVKHMKSFVEILVIDSGQGIPKKVAARIMEPFFTTKDIGKGTGMGLSISHGIIQQEGGELRYDPNYPNTTFVIRLPKRATLSNSEKSAA